MSDRRAQVRAALVALHLVLITVMAIPKPSVSEKELQSEGVQRWFRGTAASLRSMGLDVEADELREVAVPLGRAWLGVRDAVLVPGGWYARIAGTHQSWRMFAGVGPESARLSIVGVFPDGEEELYRSRSAELTWRRRFFDHERVRTLTNNFVHKRKRHRFERLTAWATDRLSVDYPDAVAFRFQMEPTEAPLPEVLRERGALVGGEPYWVTTVKARQ